MESKSESMNYVKFTFSEKATKIDKIFTVNLTVQAFLDFSGFNFRNF